MDVSIPHNDLEIQQGMKRDRRPSVYCHTRKGSDAINDGSVLKDILKYYIPSAFFLCCIIVLIKLHSDYRYGYWWVGEEYVIGGAISIFIAILSIYYFIVRNKLHGSK